MAPGRAQRTVHVDPTYRSDETYDTAVAAIAAGIAAQRATDLRFGERLRPLIGRAITAVAWDDRQCWLMFDDLALRFGVDGFRPDGPRGRSRDGSSGRASGWASPYPTQGSELTLDVLPTAACAVDRCTADEVLDVRFTGGESYRWRRGAELQARIGADFRKVHVDASHAFIYAGPGALLHLTVVRMLADDGRSLGPMLLWGDAD